jgi:hypothetical protein
MLQGRSLETVPRDELLRIIDLMGSQLDAIWNEIDRRKTVSDWKWGFRTTEGYVVYDDIDAASVAIRSYFNDDPDAHYGLVKVYL